MRVGVDIDGVLFPWADVANEAVMEKFGIPDPGPHYHWNWLKAQISPEQWAWLWSPEGQGRVFSQVRRRYAGATQMVEAFLGAGHEVHFVTHRDPRRTCLLTSHFLTYHFGEHTWAGVHVLNHAIPKHALAEWDVFIDDKEQTVLEMLMYTSAQVFTPARPWNQDLEDARHPRLWRYNDPKEVTAWLRP